MREPCRSLDTLSSVVPESVPRPVANAIVGVVGFSFVALVLKSILNTALTLLFVAGGAYLYLSRGDGGGGGGGGGGSGGNDALEDARKIMEKYK